MLSTSSSLDLLHKFFELKSSPRAKYFIISFVIAL